MKVSVAFDDKALTRATLTLPASWFGRLIGRRTRIEYIWLDGDRWRYVGDGAYIGSDLEKIVIDRLRWEEEPSGWTSSGRRTPRRD